MTKLFLCFLLAGAGLAVQALSDVIQFGFGDLGRLGYFQFHDVRGMQGVNSFHANSVGNLTDHKSAVHAQTAFAGYNQSFKNLYALLAAFLNALVDLNSVANPEFGQGLELVVGNVFDDSHKITFFFQLAQGI